MHTPHSFPVLEALEPRLAPAGIVAVNVKGGVLTLTGDASANEVEIYDAGNGVWGIRDGGGDGTTFRLNGAEAAAEVFVTVSGGIKASLQGGDDGLTFNGIQIGGPITLKDSAGNDDISFFNTQVNGAVKLDTGAGNDEVLITGSTFNSLLSVKTGAGEDEVTLIEGTFADLTVDLGTESGGFFLGDEGGASAVNVFGNVSIISKGGEGATNSITLSAGQFLITGSVKAKMGAGTNTLYMAGGSFLVTGGLAFTGGTGSDIVVMESNVTIGGKADFKMGKGDSTVNTDNLDALTLGSLSYTGGSGENEVAFAGSSVTIGGDVFFNMGAGSDNDVRFNSSVNAFISGKLTYKGGKGSDILDVNAPDFQALGAVTFTAGAGFYSSFAVKSVTGTLGSVTFKGGTGLDAVRFGNSNDVTQQINVLGKMNINLGKTNSNELFIEDTTIHGAVTIAGSTNAPDQGIAYLLVKIADSTLLSSLTLKTSGSQGAVIALHNSSFLGAASITTGTGNDNVYLDSQAEQMGDTLARNLFEGPVKIILGTGDDTLTAGQFAGGPNVGNVFNGSVLFDGGAGTDLNLSLEIFGNTYNGELTEKNFDTVVV